MITAEQISKRFLIWGVAVAAISPRQPSDGIWSIGGKLSHSFRKFLLVIVAVNLARLFLSGIEEYSSASGLFSDSLGVIEVTGLSFLCLLTPYVLRFRLSGIINVGRPGQALMSSLYFVGIFSFVGVVLSRTIHPNFWCLKKLAVVASSPPVILTLKQYNSVISIGGRSHGRGFIISQILMAIEYWHIFVQLSCALGYAFNRGYIEQEDTFVDKLLRSARMTAFLADWTRILCHATFLNMMDELDHTGGYAVGGDDVSDHRNPMLGGDRVNRGLITERPVQTS